MRDSKALAALACAIALCLALVGCVGSSGGAGKASASSNSEAAVDVAKLIGTWELSGSIDADGVRASDDSIALMRELGLDLFVNLNEDATFDMVVFEGSLRGTWDAVSRDTIVFETEGDSLTVKIEDGVMVWRIEETRAQLEFTKAAENRKAPAKAASASEAGGLSSLVVNGIEDQEVVPIDPVVIADDEICKIVVTAMKVDFVGDPCYALAITNKTDAAIMVIAPADTFSVNGRLVDPILYEEVEPGDAIEGVLWFDAKELGSSDLSQRVAVEGAILIVDRDTNAAVREYDFIM